MQHSSKPFSRFLAIPLLAGIAVLGVAGNQPVPSGPLNTELREIIDRTLERAAWAEEEGFETRYRRAMTQRVQRFDGDGEVTDDETLLYQVEPYQGALFRRLMARDGEPIDARDRREQERRWEEFQAEIDDPGKRAEREREAAENEIKFDEELVGRFTVGLDGVRDLRGRPSYVISFEPRPGPLPVRRRIDHALNARLGSTRRLTRSPESAFS